MGALIRVHHPQPGIVADSGLIRFPPPKGGAGNETNRFKVGSRIDRESTANGKTRIGSPTNSEGAARNSLEVELGTRIRVGTGLASLRPRSRTSINLAEKLSCRVGFQHARFSMAPSLEQFRGVYAVSRSSRREQLAEALRLAEAGAVVGLAAASQLEHESCSAFCGDILKLLERIAVASRRAGLPTAAAAEENARTLEALLARHAPRGRHLRLVEGAD